MKRARAITWEEVRVAVLLVAGLAILGVGVFYVGETGSVFGQRYRLVTLMESSSGLAPGAMVQLAGQPVGQVAEIRFIPVEERPETGEKVAVWLSIDRAVQHQIRGDSRAVIQTQGLLGDRLVNIEPGGRAASVLEPGDTLVASSPLDYEELFSSTREAVTSLTDVTRNLNELTEGLLAGEGTLGLLVSDPALYRELVDLSGSLDSTLALANTGEGALGRLLREGEVYDRLLSSLAAMDTVTGRIAAGEGSLGRLVASDSLYRSLAATARHADSLLARVQEGRGAAGQLFTEDELYEELLRTVVDLNAILADLRQDPRKYIPPVTVF